MYQQKTHESECYDSRKEITKCEEIALESHCEDDTQQAKHIEESEDNMEYVNFYMAGKLVYSKQFSLDTNIAQIKIEFAHKYKLSDKDLQIMHWHVFLNDCTTLRYIPVTTCACVINLTVVNLSSETPLELQNMVIPDIITVQIESEDVYNEVTVEIEDRSVRKPYIGGYRNKDTGIEYHHAYSQTGPPKEKLSPREKNSRDTQTIDTRNRLQQMVYSRATQMKSDHIWIPTITDKILTAKKYETAEEREKRIDIEGKVRTIQRYYHRWKLNKALKVLCAEYHRKKESEELAKQQIKDDDEKMYKKEIVGKLYPSTRGDFQMLYAMVERWKKAHTKRIAELHAPAAKLAEYYMLLDKEVEMLRIIDKQRQQVKEDGQIAKEIQFFDTISTPIAWTGYKGLHISMDTLETQIGRKFKEIYFIASNYNLTKNERIKFLTDLSAYLKEHNCIIGNELMGLLEREIQLLNLGIDNKNLDMLHKRIQALLLKHYKTPECNLNVTKRMKKLKAKYLEENLLRCPKCEKVKPIKEFVVKMRDKSMHHCIACASNDQVIEPMVDVTKFRVMLNEIRREEHRRGAHSSAAFIMQEKDIGFLVDIIWHSRSILTQCTDLGVLKCVRWDVKMEWAPWNCIVLTEEEANLHLRLKRLGDVYDEKFRRIVLSRHLLARCFFCHITSLERYLGDEEPQELDEHKTNQ